jgi:hypothetical protein
MSLWRKLLGSGGQPLRVSQIEDAPVVTTMAEKRSRYRVDIEQRINNPFPWKATISGPAGERDQMFETVTEESEERMRRVARDLIDSHINKTDKVTITGDQL